MADTVAAPPSRGKRFLKLAGMTASVAGNMAKTKVKALFQSEEAAEAESHPLADAVATMQKQGVR